MGMVQSGAVRQTHCLACPGMPLKPWRKRVGVGEAAVMHGSATGQGFNTITPPLLMRVGCV